MPALPAGRALSRAAVGRAASCSTRTAMRCCRTTTGEIEGRAAFFDLSLDGRWGGVISGDKISLDFEPVRLRQRGPDRSATTSPAMPTSKATTRSAAPAPSTPTCEAWHDDHRRERTDSATVSAPFFLAARWSRAPTSATGRATSASTSPRPRLDLDALVTPRTELPPLLDVPLAEIIDFLVETGQRLVRSRQRASCRSARPHGVHATSLPRSVVENHRRARGRPTSTSAVLIAERRAELPRPPGARRLGAEAPTHRPPQLRPRLPAAPDPRAAGQLAGRGGQVDRPGRAGQGDQPVQDAVERPVLRRSPSCAPWPTSIPTTRSSSRCRRSTGAAATSASSACSTGRSTSTRSSPGAAAMRSTT